MGSALSDDRNITSGATGNGNLAQLQSIGMQNNRPAQCPPGESLSGHDTHGRQLPSNLGGGGGDPDDDGDDEDDDDDEDDEDDEDGEGEEGEDDSHSNHSSRESGDNGDAEGDDNDSGDDEEDDGDNRDQNQDMNLHFIGNEDDPDDPDDPGNGDPNSDDSSSDEELHNFSLMNEELNIVCRTLTNCTVREVLAVVLALGSRHKMTYDALINLMKAFNTLYGRKYLPIDKKILWRLLGRSEVGILKHAYCSDCHRALGRLHNLADEVRCICGVLIKKRFCKYFIELNVKKQILNLLRKQSIRDALRYREERQVRIPGTMEDILDGNQYKHLAENNGVLSSHFNYSYTFNLDGFSTARSSTAEAWPIYLMWNELPPMLRKKHILLAGVWLDKKKPNMNMFLESFVNQANFLSAEGVRWQPAEAKEEVISKFIPTCFVVDAQARCAILNLNGPTGYCACPFCDHGGVYVGGCVHFPILPPVPIPHRRTHLDIVRCMIEASENLAGRDNVLGFKGASQLMLMDYFNLSKGVVTDDLHPFSGVIEHHTEILLTRTREYEPPYYFGILLTG
jgi:hypothetical protein